MSEFKIEVVRVGPVEKHPNADSLSITRVYDYPVILRTGEFQEGDRAVYVPVDSVVPGDDPRWEFLQGHTRIRAKRLRGIFSMGLLTAADPAWEVGRDAREALRITKYEPPLPLGAGDESEPDPGFLPTYTDLEGLRRWGGVLREGEEVVLTEKIHGASGRFLWNEGRLWVGSHKQIKRESPTDLWWKAARRRNLAEKLATAPGIALYGEVYGYVQDLRYGFAPGEADLAVFDALDIRTRQYLDADDLDALLARLELPRVPQLYRGPWSEALRELANGRTTTGAADHVREGFVVRPVKERWDDRVGRVILKLHGEDYLLRKERG